MRKKILTKNVKIMGVVSFLNDFSSEMAAPMIPVFLTTVLGAPVSIVGLVEGIADASADLLMSVAGIRSDKVHKRKPFVVIGYSLSAISKLLYALSYSWPMMLFGRAVNRAGKGIRTTSRDALLLQDVDKKDRGKVFGFHRTMDTFGAIFGPLFAIFLLKILNNDYRTLFFYAFIPSFLAMILVPWLKENRQSQNPYKTIHFEWKKTNHPFRVFLAISIIFALATSSYSFLVLRAKDLGLGISSIMTVYILFNAFNALFSVPAGYLSDRLGQKRVLIGGYLLFTLVYLAFGLAKSSWVTWILFPLYGIYIAMTDGVSAAYISKLVPHEISASAFGIYRSSIGITTFLSSFLAGIIWSSFGSQYTFYFSAVLALVAVGLFVIFGGVLNHDKR